MRSSARNVRLDVVAALASSAIATMPIAAADSQRLDIGQAVREADVSSWNIDVGIDGTGLPPGEGSVRTGKSIYESQCISCHGAEGRGGPMDRLSGGVGTLKSDEPVRTIGSYWPYATTLFDYVRRAMPLGKPQSLSPDEVYALIAYLLHLNGIIDPNMVMNDKTLPKVQMPNKAAFRSDPRPDVSNVACQRDCK